MLGAAVDAVQLAVAACPLHAVADWALFRHCAALQGWGENDRGVSYTFGPDSVTEFLQKHDLDLVCRAHQASLAMYTLQLCKSAAGRSGGQRQTLGQGA